MSLGLDVKELPYFEVFDIQWPQMIKMLKSEMLVDTIRVYMQKIASLSVFIKVWPQLAIFDLQWPHTFDPITFLGKVGGEFSQLYFKVEMISFNCR